MNRKPISEEVKRRLYAESMGRCMNPECQKDLFFNNGDIAERAHIVPYAETEDNSFENLVILCPNCHTLFDKNANLLIETVKEWKRIRKEQVEKFFCKKYENFDSLSEVVVPLLLENKTIYENYYLKDEKQLWDKFESKLIVNNKKLKIIFENNLNLFQRHKNKDYSNLQYIYTFISHINEFETTRMDAEKHRQILFPTEINSMFGITPICDKILPSTFALESLITKLNEEGKFQALNIGNENPYIQLNGEGLTNKIYLNDTPRLRQLYYVYKCKNGPEFRFESLNFALKYITSKKLAYCFKCYNNLREIKVKNEKIIFVYNYCLSQTELLQLAPQENCVIYKIYR